MARAEFTEPPAVTLRLRGAEARFLRTLLGNISQGQLALILERDRRDVIAEFRDCLDDHHPLHTIWDALGKLDIGERKD